MGEPAETGLTALFFAVFAVFWVFGVRRAAQTSGWQDLATSYRTTGKFRGPKRYLQSGYVGKMSHGGTLILGADAGGLYMSVLAPFRFGHEPLYIPWSDISAQREKRSFMNYAVLTFAKHPNAAVRTHPRTAKRLADWSRGQFVLPTKSES
jgi:hypothetical protein